MAQARDLPIIVGTEMNAYGQKFVDDFDAPELAPVAPAFLEGAAIVYAHTVLEAHAAMGYLSNWARAHFPSIRDKNAFFCALGLGLQPGREYVLGGVTPESKPEDILALL
ncbi:MAG TPA: hypothetical protein ENN80_10500 [Candidatus Hydrogenedentes bacterium]|nr:hypothetical protein [Candidatus Hydrogenedentota bacterium]